MAFTAGAMTLYAMVCQPALGTEANLHVMVTRLLTLGAVGLQLGWGLVAALLLNRAFRGLNFVRSLFVLPYLARSRAGRRP